MRIRLILPALAVAGLLAACSGTGPGGGNGRVITGTITVPPGTDWASVKLGIFSGGALGAHPNTLDATDNGLNDETKYRLVYYDVSSGADEIIAPVGGASYTISDTGATSRTYSFELPSSLPLMTDLGNRESYYFVLWYDTGATPGSLDLKNGTTA